MQKVKPIKETEFFCTYCDWKIVNSEDEKTGKFFTQFGHRYNAVSKQFNGEFVEIMFAVCSDCLTDEGRINYE